MAFVEGTKLGRYEIRSLIGAGGMGEVYLARDPKIGRDVAIKVLPETLADDKERLARFEQEAQAAGSLNHPNILAIYDVQADGGAPYVVSELLEGETLRESIGGTPLPIRKALGYGLQIAHGLAAAHEKGIIHRDLKPENLFVTADGRVKILDFGLAKLTESGHNGNVSTDLPTRKVNTDAGAVMGTVGYMSPEQLRGRPVDQRTDIFSFGSVLYEMLSGQKAFQRDSTADTISAILREDPPDLSETNKSVDHGLERIVHRCLEKNKEERFHSASDLAFALEALTGVTDTGKTRAVSAYTEEFQQRRSFFDRLPWLGWAAAALLLVFALYLLWHIYQEPAAGSGQIASFNLAAPDKTQFGDAVSVSPDGKQVAFISVGELGEATLWIRPINSVDAKQLPGTEGAAFPFWSPDSRYIAFFSGSKLKKIDAIGGPPQTLAEASTDVRGGAWGPDGTILFAPNTLSPLMKVSANGGSTTQFTSLDESKLQSSHRWPSFLPDGKHFIYFARGQEKEREGIYAASLDSPNDAKLLLSTNLRAEYCSVAANASKGFLLFARERTLLAQAFDPAKLELIGDPVAIAQNLLSFPTEVGPTGYASFSTSMNGLLVYRTGGTQLTELKWFDRDGKEQEKLTGLGLHHEPQIFADGKRVLYGREEGGSYDIWMADMSRSTQTRLTFSQTPDASPAWSPDGSSIVYSSFREGKFQMFQKPSNGSGNEELLLKADGAVFPDDWSRDGKYIVYEMDTGPQTKIDLWVLPLFGDRKPFPFLATDFQETHSRLSPDGRFIAYVSDESGRPEVYVQTFPNPGGKWQISSTGGDQPVWRSDGKELYFLAADRNLMAVAMNTSPEFEAGRPQTLFTARLPQTNMTDDRNNYSPTPDGKRFLVAAVPAETTSYPITVVLNWAAELKK